MLPIHYINSYQQVQQVQQVQQKSSEFYGGWRKRITEGWFYKNGSWFYMGTGQKLYKNGIYKIKDQIYAFGETGNMLTGYRKINGNFYHFSSKGPATIGWLWNPTAKKYQYFTEGSNGAAYINGVYRIGNSYYGFDQNGNMLIGYQTVNEKSYDFGIKGPAITGWVWNPTTQTYQYFNPENGAAYTNGVFTIAGSDYGFDKTGNMLTGYQTIDGKQYDFSNSGVEITGWVWNKDLKNYQYFSEKNKGSMLVGLQTIDEKQYLFASNGSMQTGLQTIDGNVYYFYPTSGYMAKNTTIYPKGLNVGYTFGANGILVN